MKKTQAALYVVVAVVALAAAEGMDLLNDASVQKSPTESGQLAALIIGACMAILVIAALEAHRNLSVARQEELVRTGRAGRHVKVSND